MKKFAVDEKKDIFFEKKELEKGNNNDVYTIVPVFHPRTKKVNYFYTNGIDVKINDYVYINIQRGPNYGVVIGEPINTVSDGKEYHKIDKILSQDEINQLMLNRKYEERAKEICIEKAKELNLKMKVVDVEFTPVINKAIFYFTANGRIDFRELVKILAREIKMIIEMRQIGIRDEAKLVGGIGICGHQTCCSSFLHKFNPVSIKMAKNQDIVLNPQKVSGLCGRLICCLAYEDDLYTELKKDMPTVDSIVKTKKGTGKVVYVDIFQKKVKVKFDEDNIETFNTNEIVVEKLAESAKSTADDEKDFLEEEE